MKQELSERVLNMATSGPHAMAARTRELKAEGNETLTNHNNRSRAVGGVWGVDARNLNLQSCRNWKHRSNQTTLGYWRECECEG